MQHSSAPEDVVWFNHSREGEGARASPHTATHPPICAGDVAAPDSSEDGRMTWRDLVEWIAQLCEVYGVGGKCLALAAAYVSKVPEELRVSPMVSSACFVVAQRFLGSGVPLASDLAAMLPVEYQCASPELTVKALARTEDLIIALLDSDFAVPTVWDLTAGMHTCAPEEVVAEAAGAVSVFTDLAVVSCPEAEDPRDMAVGVWLAVCRLLNLPPAGADFDNTRNAAGRWGLCFELIWAEYVEMGGRDGQQMGMFSNCLKG
mmetsp:Transcript_25016/g.48646  ORF Transcript_25016/g.48646 Transcript_25016/m.48646 type:complete len:261 (-) Transcript_25016:417-1199(-)